jgi:hypothetical protein
VRGATSWTGSKGQEKWQQAVLCQRTMVCARTVQKAEGPHGELPAGPQHVRIHTKTTTSTQRGRANLQISTPANPIPGRHSTCRPSPRAMSKKAASPTVRCL